MPQANELKRAYEKAQEADLQYRLASFTDKLKMKADRDKALSEYAKARVKMFNEGLIAPTEKFSSNDLEKASEKAQEADLQYRLASFTDKLKMKADRDKALSEYAKARIKK